MHVVPDSRDPHATRLDPVGALLSIAAIGSLVYAIIQAPERGWTSTARRSPTSPSASRSGSLFVGWELRRDDPMLDIGLFRNRSFSAGSIALAMLFFAMAGTVFLQAQYLQFVLDYTPLAAGFALVPPRSGCCSAPAPAPTSPPCTAVGSPSLPARSSPPAALPCRPRSSTAASYLPTGIGLLLFGLGAGVAMPAATEIIMATLPPARAGVGSAVNDTVREFGGALGVAVIGSIAATGYATSMRDRARPRSPNLTDTDRGLLTDNVGAAVHTSRQLGAQGDQIAIAARTAFVDSMSTLALGRRRARRSAPQSSPSPNSPATRRTTPSRHQSSSTVGTSTAAPRMRSPAATQASAS